MNWKTKEQQKAELRKQLMGQLAGFSGERRRALHAAALVHGFALLAFVTAFGLVVDLRARVAELEAIVRSSSGVAVVSSGR